MNKAKSNIRAVTFDLWETLLLETDGWSLRRRNARCQGLARTLEKFGVKISVEEIALAFRKMTPWLANIWNTNSEVTYLDQIRFILKATSKGAIRMREEWIEDLSSAYVSAILEVPPYLNPDARKVLLSLKEQGKLVGLICNVGLTPGFGIRRFLIKKGIAKYFDLMLFSDEVSFRKPNAKIFRVAAQRLKVKPYETVHVGDNLKSDIWGAKNAGFKAIHFLADNGRDRTAESDPTSLVSISRRLYDLKEETIIPDKTITSLAEAIQAIQEL